ncbi:hypothetical protein GGR61_001763 [Xanthomonas arboricola]|nr:hypothetical protein [Xanthomonas sp. 3058]
MEVADLVADMPGVLIAVDAAPFAIVGSRVEMRIQ